MATQKVLFPYNFTRYDKKASDFVIRVFAGLEDAEITLFHAYPPAPKVEIDQGSITDRLKHSMSYLSQKISDQEAELKTARQNLLDNGFSENRVNYIFKPRKKDIAGEIMDCALEGGFNLIVLNQKPGAITRYFTGSVHNKVINASKDITVCIVR